ncbi:MAG: hypothetical protein IJT43_04040 [Stomatobaculum sp.]|nr:hypothetical protein [Stomatobaculum sp.]
MTQQIEDSTAFLKEARQALTEVNSLEQEEERLKAEEAKTLRELETEEKALKDEIDSTLRKRLQEINTTYDSEIAKKKDELKKAKARREKAKNEGIEERIREETKPILEDSAEKKKEMVNAFQKQKIPSYYATRLYYALHFPHKPVDILVLLLFVGVFFVALPCGIYFLAIPEALRSAPVLVVIYVLSILIFGGLYTYIGNSSKSKYSDMLQMGKETWDDLAKNKKLVRKLTKQIRRDKDEDKYDLGSFDDEIARVTQEISETNTKKQEALTTFDTVTKNIITDELTQNSKEKIGQLMSAHDEAYRRLREVGTERQQKKLALTDQYEVRLGKEFMSEEKIDALSDILTRGAASSLTDAMTEYRTNRIAKDRDNTEK